MSSQFDKRNKKKDAETEVSEVKVELTGVAFDIVDVEGRPHVVTINYDLESKEAKVVAVKKVDRNVSLPFANKKTALMTLIGHKK